LVFIFSGFYWGNAFFCGDDINEPLGKTVLSE
jgi:hypothetical protein